MSLSWRRTWVRRPFTSRAQGLPSWPLSTDDTEFFTRAEAALAADGPLRHFTVHRLLADNVGAVVS